MGRAHRPARAGRCWRWRRWSCRAGPSRPRPCSARLAPSRSRGPASPPLPPAPTARSGQRPRRSRQPAAARRASLSPIAATTALYAVPAAILLFITFLALARLIALRARADVLVDGHWLSALARAQRRMGFKHGTALLTSDELASPISWGLMRPVILLNTRAVEASGEAEAIIAHELAHVARMDWAKLLLARVATALVLVQPAWSGCSPAKPTSCARKRPTMRCSRPTSSTPIMPSCWSASRATNARACCSARTASRRRRARSRAALPACSTPLRCAARPRGPSPPACSSAPSRSPAPLAALTLTPKGTAENAKLAAAAQTRHGASRRHRPIIPASDVPTDLPSIIGEGVATSVQSAVAAINPQRDRQSGGAISNRQPVGSERSQQQRGDGRKQSERRHRHRLPARRAGPPEDRLPRDQRRHRRDLCRCRMTKSPASSKSMLKREKASRKGHEDEGGGRDA